MSKAKETVVFEQIWRRGLRGRIVEVNGQLIAQVGKGSDDWQRANTKQCVSLFRNAFHVSRLTPGSPVIAWDGNRMVRGSFVGRFCDRFEVHVSRSEKNLMAEHVLPFSVAQREGIWPFRRGMQVAAYVGETWVRAIWVGYEEGSHKVNVGGNIAYSDRAHCAHDAIEMGLLSD